MELIEALYHRRAVRDYTDQAVSKEILRELIDAAIQAPSALNEQPWSFAVFRGRDRLKMFSDRAKDHLVTTISPSFEPHSRVDRYASADFNMFYNASVLIVICAKPSRFNSAEDCCLAAQNFMLAAHARGLATCPIGFARSWLNLPTTKADLGIPSAHSPVLPIIVGYPAGPTQREPRRDPEIVVWE